MSIITQQDINKRQKNFKQLGINEREPPPKIIQFGGANLTARQGAETTIIYAEVIEAPARPNPTADPDSPEYDGWSHYILRLLTDATATYNAATHYVIGDACIASNNRRYISKTGTVGSPNVGNDPVGDEVNWEVSEEIKVEYALGLESPARNLRYCIPWFEPGAVVPLVSRVVGENTRYYINQTFIYCGEPEDSGLIYDTNHKMTRAVFA